MNILVTAVSFSSKLSGIQRHAFNLVRCLLQRPEITSLHIVVAPWQSELLETMDIRSGDRLSTHIAHLGTGSLARNIWYYKHLPKLATQLNADLVHLSYPMPVRAAAFACPTVVTLHDLYPYEIPQNFGFPKFFFNRLTLQQCLRNVNAIACVSDVTKQRLQQYTSSSIWHKATRIYNCIEARAFPSQTSQLPSWRGEPFLLCVAQHRRNKNVALLIRTFRRLLNSPLIDSRMKLFVVGINGPETKAIRHLITTFNLSDSVHLLDGLSESHLQWCYKHCEALVAPSVTEGFGLPVAEGLLAGTRVVCSHIPAHREVGNNSCRFINLQGNAEENLGEAIVDALNEPKYQAVSLPQFSSHVLAEQYVTLYRQLIAFSADANGSAFSAATIQPSAEGRMG